MPKNTDGTFTLCGSCATRGQCAGRNVCAIERMPITDEIADTGPLFYGGCGVERCMRCLPRFDADNREIT